MNECWGGWEEAESEKGIDGGDRLGSRKEKARDGFLSD